MLKYLKLKVAADQQEVYMNDNAITPFYSIGISKDTVDKDFNEMHINISNPETEDWIMKVSPPDVCQEESPHRYTYWTKKKYERKDSEYSFSCEIEDDSSHHFQHTFRRNDRKNPFLLSIGISEKTISFTSINLIKDDEEVMPRSDALSLAWEPLAGYETPVEYQITCGSQTVRTSETACVIRNKTGYSENTIYITGKDTFGNELTTNYITILTMS